MLPTARSFFDSTYRRSNEFPLRLPYATVISKDGTRDSYRCGMPRPWLNLIWLAEKFCGNRTGKAGKALAGGSHPTALLLNRDSSILFVALTNRDQIVALDARSGKTLYTLSTKPAGQAYGGSDPQSLALAPDENTLFSANAISDSIAVFDLTSHASSGFIPTSGIPRSSPQPAKIC